jgi:hypothetical protein
LCNQQLRNTHKNRCQSLYARTCGLVLRIGMPDTKGIERCKRGRHMTMIQVKRFGQEMSSIAFSDNMFETPVVISFRGRMTTDRKRRQKYVGRWCDCVVARHRWVRLRELMCFVSHTIDFGRVIRNRNNLSFDRSEPSLPQITASVRKVAARVRGC